MRGSRPDWSVFSSSNLPPVACFNVWERLVFFENPPFADCCLCVQMANNLWSKKTTYSTTISPQKRPHLFARNSIFLNYYFMLTNYNTANLILQFQIIKGKINRETGKKNISPLPQNESLLKLSHREKKKRSVCSTNFTQKSHVPSRKVSQSTTAALSHWKVTVEASELVCVCGCGCGCGCGCVCVCVRVFWRHMDDDDSFSGLKLRWSVPPSHTLWL